MWSCKDKEDAPVPTTGRIQLAEIIIGGQSLDLNGNNNDIPVDSTLKIRFNNTLDSQSAGNHVTLVKNDTLIPLEVMFENNDRTMILKPEEPLDHRVDYTLSIGNGLRGAGGETFPGYTVHFTTENGDLLLEVASVNGFDILTDPAKNVDFTTVNLEFQFSHRLDPDEFQSYFFVTGNFDKTINLSENQKTVTITNLEDLTHYRKHHITILESLTAANGFEFTGFSNDFFTQLDSTYKFPPIPDDALLSLVQEQTFRYFYEFAEPNSGMARERNTSGDIVTTGGSGFGVMALIVGMERNFITRQEGIERLDKILTFLETCDRFHGAWPHWLYGSTGEVRPFSELDDGGDLVETAFMVQGLLTMRQYLNPAVPGEQTLIERINVLVDAVEWDWYTKGENVLYWHWSPNVGFQLNHQIRGWNETLITYVLAASSEMHGIAPEVYHDGYAVNGGMTNGNSYYGYLLPLGPPLGGPLFFAHYSFLGLDPRNLQDAYANYWEQNVNHALINWAYCTDNPKDYVGYSPVSWGLTASDNPEGYNAHSPTNDLGVITPTAAVSSLPYTPEQSMDAIRHFYFLLGDRLWGDYGFYDAFNVNENWWASSYLAIDQGPIVCMIENHRNGLLWDLFMSCPEVQQGLDELGFIY